jgi:superfamily II DNA or RNA helicase
MELRPYQVRGIEQILAADAAGHRAICLQAVTGAGKSLMMVHLIQGWERAGYPVAVYTNRRLLFAQLGGVFDGCGITHGKRAAGYRTSVKRGVQLAMVQTERSKSLGGSRQLHAARFVIVDEAHLNSTGATEEILRRHLAEGATIVGFTATPVGIGHLYKHLICCCGTSEARQAGAILPAKCYGIEEPDMHWVRKVATGEEIGGKMRKRYCQMIFGRVIEHWERLNPERLPTILFAPDVASANWFAQQMEQRGINAAAIDAQGVYYQEMRRGGELAKESIIEKLRAGEIEILCNRWVLREAVDIPGIYHAILATRFGSETTFIQAVGRVLRNHPSLPGHVLIQDHGGNFIPHGSPNQDREWELDDTNEGRSYERRELMREEKIEEPIICAKCFALRRSGNVCQSCGYCGGRSRQVLQTDGQLKEVHGKKYRRMPVAVGEQMEKLWLSSFWSARKNPERSYAQTIAWFGERARLKTGRWVRPDPSWFGMPQHLTDHKLRVADVPWTRIVGGKQNVRA